jgi:hypothetical protein
MNWSTCCLYPYLTLASLENCCRWLHLTVAALCVTTGSVWIANNKREFRAALLTLKMALQDFLNEHMLEPIECVRGWLAWL